MKKTVRNAHEHRYLIPTPTAMLKYQPMQHFWAHKQSILTIDSSLIVQCYHEYYNVWVCFSRICDGFQLHGVNQKKALSFNDTIQKSFDPQMVSHNGIRRRLAQANDVPVRTAKRGVFPYGSVLSNCGTLTPYDFRHNGQRCIQSPVNAQTLVIYES